MKIYMVKHVYLFDGQENYLRDYYNNYETAFNEAEDNMAGDLRGGIFLMKWDEEGHLVPDTCIKAW